MTENTLAQTIDAAAAAHQAGRFEDALKGYRAALEAAPEDAEVNSLVGLALTHLHRFDEAGPYLEKAVKAEPKEAGFRLNRLEWLEQTGQTDPALEEIEALLELDPELPRIWEKLGDLCVRKGKPGAATDAYLEALRRAPGSYPLMMKFARAHAGYRNFKAARQVLEEAAQYGPRDENYLELYSFVLGALGDIETLAALSREWTERAPQSAPAWRALSQAAYERGRYREAVAAFRKAMDLSGRDADRLAAYGRICLSALEFDEARAALGEAESLDANHAEMLAAKGLLLTYEGRFEDAETYCRRCLAANPSFAGAYTQLSRLTGGRMSEAEKKTLSELAWDKAQHAEDRAAAAYALGHALDAEGDRAHAFKIYQHANDIALSQSEDSGIRYRRDAVTAREETLKKLFSGPVEHRADEDRRPRPIFIVGMPRSGTTLIESLLSAHRDVFAGGERPDMQHLLNNYLSRAEGKDVAATGPVNPKWIESYYAELPDPEGAGWLTDKNPLNFEAVGLIDRLFPGAPIIHIRRNPLETGLSIFRHEFSKFWPFANRLEDIGHFYGYYARLMDHWDKAYPGRVVTVQYEDFAGDFENAAPALAERIGLPWSQAMADFQKAERPVATFSAVQAREAVSVRRGKAEAYADYLRPLADALEKAGVDPETGALKA
ncbi:tetratricopeptide repeat-containing sulfotransferase family protein [Hyphococcus luteus]|uniref:Uncharacterized protein n=1 Tax=Hyphococcus luteus TaxID=2058213 RepID=A0A2S7K945_9PROT|nr:tetratricopeptide repeat-containing sulfotransferase family protein [Marinicaulis flavus]PQA89022.1 hypothetical protein CW354_03470 [Marinicaulis flavus]